MQVVGLGLIAALLVAVVRQVRPELAFPVSLLAGAVILLFLVTRVAAVVALLSRLADSAGLRGPYLGAVLRIIGIAYLAEFGAQIARDSGESALAGKIELGGKILILIMAMPIVTAVLDLVGRMMP